MATTMRRIATEKDLLVMPKDGQKYELVDGQIRVSPAGDRHSVVALRLGSRLLAFATQHRLGHVCGADAGFRLPGGNIRSPDASFIASGRFRDDKVGEYLEAGVRLVWIIDPRKARAVVYRSLSDVRKLGSEDALDGEDVLPGFRCTLGEIL